MARTHRMRVVTSAFAESSSSLANLSMLRRSRVCSRRALECEDLDGYWQASWTPADTHMSVAGAAISAGVRSVNSTDAMWLAKSDSLERVACGGVIALVLLSPFEALRPLLRIPGQSFSTVEAALLCVVAACAVAVVVSRQWPRVPLTDALPWAALVCAAVISASVAPAFKSNAVHMAVRHTIQDDATLVKKRGILRDSVGIEKMKEENATIAEIILQDFVQNKNYVICKKMKKKMSRRV